LSSPIGAGSFLTVKWEMNQQASLPNHTEANPKILPKRAAYVASHWPYVNYMELLLDRASLPASTWALPNVTNMAAMVSELRSLYPEAPRLNAIVLGRFLHRFLSPLLTWHGGYYAEAKRRFGALHHCETTAYRLPEVQRSRMAFEAFTQTEFTWSNDFDQWRAIGDIGD
jgi:hypothetical protein